MVGLGTIINTAAIIVGGILGLLFGKLINERIQDTLKKANGVSVLFIGISGALEGMFSVSEGSIVSGKSMLIVISIALGALVGEAINIEHWLERFGEWLKAKTGNAKDKNFVDGFVTTTLTACIGAMAVVGAIKDGIYGDYSILTTKAILDLITVMVMTCSLGKGCMFSAIPVLIFQGSMTALAKLIEPLMTEAALTNLSIVGSVLIFCVGLNLLWDKKIRAANLLPSLIFAVAIAFLPINI